MTDKDCDGRVGNSYECKTCSRYFSSKKARNLCTHGRCISCGEFKDDVHWIEGKGFYCERCGLRMAIYDEKMHNKVCCECGSKKNLLEMKEAWVCQRCYDKNPELYMVMSR